MKVELERALPIAAGADAAWGLLQDIGAVAACLPGAKITERIDDRHYKGTVTVRVGPATMSFRGEIEVSQVDTAARALCLSGKGTDTTGTSAASMDLKVHIEGAANACKLVGRSEISMSGKAAAFGGRMLTSVADQLLKQFATNFAALLSAPAGPGAAPGVGAAASAGAATSAAGAPQANSELNALALLWAMLKDWLHAIFGRGAA